jgi:Domain of unknown function (DUF5916)/Carbohydrate family 9 binding domain-like
VLRTTIAFTLALAHALLLPPVAAAQERSEARAERVRRLKARTWEVRAVRLSGDLQIDGKLDDPAWASALPVTDFYQRETHEGLPATEPTHVYVLFDDTNLYFGFRCFDDDPKRPLAKTMFRDENIAADDGVSVMIDAYNDHRSAVQLATNANGILFDMLQNGEESSTRNLNWDTVWYARGSQIDGGWEAEIEIPFKSLRFEPPADGREVVFGIGFKRNLPRKNEETYWPFVSNDSTWYRPAELGQLRGLEGIRSGRSVELRPYALGGITRDTSMPERDMRSEVGIDAKWGVTTGLTADFTVNTDFAQEEADVQQINFTRFSLFFPEKRQIFLESERSFLFGVPREADLIFTRRIGLSRSGGIIPILAGARLSGRQGAYNVGIMNMETDDVPDTLVPKENFTVVRLRRDIFKRSNVGAVFTNRQSGSAFNRVYGADLNLYFGSWSLESYYAAEDDDPGRTRGTSSAYAKLEYRSDRYGAIYRYLGIGEGFDPGIGFVLRPDSRQNQAQLRFSPRPASIDWVRQFHFTGTFDYIPNQRGVLETRRVTGEFRTTLEAGHETTMRYTSSHEFLEEPFRLRPGVVIAPGAYDFSTMELRFDSFGRSHRRLNVGFLTGGFWDGERETLALGGGYRLDKHLDLSGNYEVNWVHLPGNEFTTHLASARVQIAFTTDLVLMSLFQYNHDSRQLSSNVRFNWIPKPGSDLFVVYNELDDVFGSLGLRNRSLSVKFNYLFAL